MAKGVLMNSLSRRIASDFSNVDEFKYKHTLSFEIICQRIYELIIYYITWNSEIFSFSLGWQQIKQSG